MSAVTWQDDAACRGMPIERFFPFPNDDRTRDEAFSVCADCQVTAECGAFAEELQVADGIWAGRDLEHERRRRSHRKMPSGETAEAAAG